MRFALYNEGAAGGKDAPAASGDGQLAPHGADAGLAADDREGGER